MKKRRNIQIIIRPVEQREGEYIAWKRSSCRDCGRRIGRSAAGKSLDDEVIRLAVTANVRHAETRYDELLAGGYERWDTREQAEEELQRILAEWEEPGV